MLRHVDHRRGQPAAAFAVERRVGEKFFQRSYVL
jgi:hypothetical protein